MLRPYNSVMFSSTLNLSFWFWLLPIALGNMVRAMYLWETLRSRRENNVAERNMAKKMKSL